MRLRIARQDTWLSDARRATIGRVTASFILFILYILVKKTYTSV